MFEVRIRIGGTIRAATETLNELIGLIGDDPRFQPTISAWTNLEEELAPPSKLKHSSNKPKSGALKIEPGSVRFACLQLLSSASEPLAFVVISQYVAQGGRWSGSSASPALHDMGVAGYVKAQKPKSGHGQIYSITALGREKFDAAAQRA